MATNCIKAKMEMKQTSVERVEENDSFRNWCTSGGTVSGPRDGQTRTPNSWK